MSASLGAGLGTLGEKGSGSACGHLSPAELGGEPPTPAQGSSCPSCWSRLTLTHGFHSAGVPGFLAALPTSLPPVCTTSLPLRPSLGDWPIPALTALTQYILSQRESSCFHTLLTPFLISHPLTSPFLIVTELNSCEAERLSLKGHQSQPSSQRSQGGDLPDPPCSHPPPGSCSSS